VNAPITYLFDPFCGWCYAAAPQIKRLREMVGKALVQGLPTGLFGGDGKSPMTPEFRDYAWGNDQRIAQMTGQPFSATYYDNVLSNFAVPFDSDPATKAIAVAEMMEAHSGLDMLARLQKARFVEGRNLFDPETIFPLAVEIGLDSSAFRDAYEGPEGEAAAQVMVENGQMMMQQLRLRGVPALALLHGNHHHAATGAQLIDPKAGLVEALAEQFGAGGGGLPDHPH
jgi:putative protein-disulfide isomerase